MINGKVILVVEPYENWYIINSTIVKMLYIYNIYLFKRINLHHHFNALVVCILWCGNCFPLNHMRIPNFNPFETKLIFFLINNPIVIIIGERYKTIKEHIDIQGFMTGGNKTIKQPNQARYSSFGYKLLRLS